MDFTPYPKPQEHDGFHHVSHLDFARHGLHLVGLEIIPK